MTLLDQIIKRKKEEVALLKTQMPKAQLREASYFSRDAISLKKSLKTRSGIIAEFKRKSPSKGVLNQDSEVLEVTQKYQTYGASGVSILTDQDFFGGSQADLLSARARLHIPILRKDFMVDPYQFYEAKALGADVVLLIASCLSPSQTNEFTALSHELGLEVLLEIHTEDELNHLNDGIDLVGINNRNLKNFEVDLGHSVALKDHLPLGTLSIAESGIGSSGDLHFLKQKGFDGFLMGEYFMKHSDPGNAFKTFINEL